jgi:ligand-binding sensor domain-containing protein
MQPWLVACSRRHIHTLSLACAGLLLLFLLTSCGLNNGQWQKSTAPGVDMQAVAVNPASTSKVYVGSTQGTVFVSNDAGDHWSEASTGLPAGNAIAMLAFDPNGKNLYAATSQGLFRTADGTHWSPVDARALPHGACSTLAFDPRHPYVIYAAIEQAGVFMSEDGGSSWHSIQNNLPMGITVNALTYDANQQQLWAATSAGIYRMDGGRSSWSTLNTGLAQGVNAYDVEPASLVGGAKELVYVGTQHGFYISKDNGAHWSNGQESINGIAVYIVFEDFRDTSAKTLYLGTSIGVLRSVDQGQTWDMVAQGWPEGADSPALDVGGANFARLFAVSASGGVYFYPGVGTTSFSSQAFPIILVALFFIFLYVFIMRSRRRGPTIKPSAQEQETAQHTNDS